MLEATHSPAGTAAAALHYLTDWSGRTRIGLEIWALPRTDLSLRATNCLTTALSEALSNVERHSGAKLVSIAITYTAEHVLRMTVSDDGTGFDRAKVPTGSGIARMRAAFAELGGGLSVHSVPGAGTTISAAAKCWG
ncbi:ATP-binding protein [Nonomuraea sp. NPDC050202]|uniref:sensor histidine kinase n=1 Tax=Nonomuraea sp. NPDC050202 TaxID=3155035 RepID=UPI0033EC1BE4